MPSINKKCHQKFFSRATRNYTRSVDYYYIKVGREWYIFYGHVILIMLTKSCINFGILLLESMCWSQKLFETVLSTYTVIAKVLLKTEVVIPIKSETSHPKVGNPFPKGGHLAICMLFVDTSPFKFKIHFGHKISPVEQLTKVGRCVEINFLSRIRFASSTKIFKKNQYQMI